MTESNVVRWGMLSTASIGRVMARSIHEAPNAELVAVAGRNAERAKAYASELQVLRSYGTYEEILSDPNIDAIYVPLPISFHAEWTVKALEAGKHVLCEKPLAPTVAQVSKVFDAADQTGKKSSRG